MKTIKQSALVATAMIAVSIAAAWGVMTDALGADTPVRVMMVFNALLLAYYGNAIPKAVLRTSVARAARRTPLCRLGLCSRRPHQRSNLGLRATRNCNTRSAHRYRQLSYPRLWILLLEPFDDRGARNLRP